jgi:hypothetical protein
MRFIDQVVQWTGFVALIIHLSSFPCVLIIIHLCFVQNTKKGNTIQECTQPSLFASYNDISPSRLFN